MSPSSPRWENPTFAGVRSGQTILKEGERGDSVAALQGALCDMGYLRQGTADGAWGRQTTKGVKNFQRHGRSLRPGMAVNGELDAGTLELLEILAPQAGQRTQEKNIPKALFEGQRVRVVVIKDEHRTLVYDRNGQPLRILINAVGALATPTDAGLRKVASKLDERQTRATERSKNYASGVFGPRIINLSMPDGGKSSQELHGTSDLAALGEDVSHGCVRHDTDDILWLYDQMSVGDFVGIVETARDPRLLRGL